MTKKKLNEMMWGYLMLLPLLIGIITFNIIPFFQNIFYSFTNLGAFGNYKMVGLKNYFRFIQDKDVLVAFINTFKYVFFAVPIGIGIALLIAVLLNSKINGKGIYRTLLFLPAVTMPSAIAMIWKWLYNRDFGVLNIVTGYFGVDKISWLGNDNFVFWSILVVMIWSGIGYNMIILLAGLQGIPNHYYEAADIDGAGPIKKFWNITLPLLSPTLFFVSITSIIGTLQAFDIIMMMLGKTSLVEDKAISAVYMFYKQAFILHNKGYAATIALVLFLITLLITLVQLQLQKRWEID